MWQGPGRGRPDANLAPAASTLHRMHLGDWYGLATSAVDEVVAPAGFRRSGKEQWWRKGSNLRHRVATGLRKDRGADSGGFQIYLGVDLVELNELVARLRGTTVRKGLFTVSMDLAIAGQANRYREWPLGPGVDVGSVTSAASEELGRIMPVFFDEFGTLDALVARYEAADPRVAILEWRWKHVAALLLLGDTEGGLTVLRSMLEAAAPQERSTVEEAIACVGAGRY